ncbi:uncharacterized protein LOC133205755 [Saccostrea echinata]|uniref:uncharacterized protein LOC133205755 n=1 Tax=Saccostrea echinata TaxID=191078 RepID=UPI002A839B67|nr:uncharacterized protein LOC133205755 [Saccostrea echinata]
MASNTGNEPRVSNDQEKYEINVPTWPYDQWETVKKSEVTDMIAENDNKAPIPRHYHSLPRIQTNSALKELLNQLSSLTNVLVDGTNARVHKEVQELMKAFSENLRTAGVLFRGCRLIQGGSVAEGTKVGKADEYDYLLVLKVLSDRETFHLRLSDKYFKFALKPTELLETLRSEVPNLLDSDEGSVFLHYTFKELILKAILNVLDSSMPPGWKRFPAENGDVCSSHIATTLHLFSEKYDMDVDIDICLCFQLSSNDIESAAELEEKEENSGLLFSYLRCLHQIAPFEIFAIIGDGEHAFRVTNTRITAPLLELSRLLSHGPNDGRLKTYKLAKCLTNNFLPRYTNVFGCKRCCHVLVKSYILKNIILFMMKHYTDSSYWVEDKICTRVLEVFAVLKQCIEGRKDEVASVSVCCLPGRLRLDEISTNNPFIKGKPNERSAFLFTPDSHKPLHEISSSPNYQEELSTRSVDANQKIKEWFHHLNEEHWNFYELIADFQNLLMYLASKTTE